MNFEGWRRVGQDGDGQGGFWSEAWGVEILVVWAREKGGGETVNSSVDGPYRKRRGMTQARRNAEYRV